MLELSSKKLTLEKLHKLKWSYLKCLVVSLVKIILAQKFLHWENILDSTQREREPHRFPECSPVPLQVYLTFVQSFSPREEYCSLQLSSPSYLKWTTVTRTILVTVNTCESPPKVQGFARRRFNFLMCEDSLPPSEITLNIELWPLPRGAMCGTTGPCAGWWPQFQTAADRDQPSLLLSYCDGEARSVLHLLGRRTWWKRASNYDLGREDGSALRGFLLC